MDVSAVILYLQGLLASSAIIMGLIFGTALSYLTSYVVVSAPAAPEAHISTTTPPAVVHPATTTPATPTKKPAGQTPKEATPVLKPVPPPAATAPAIDPSALNIQTRNSIVNILCLSQSGGSVHSISGSGVIIDARGVILTNAHIGQYFLLKDYPSKNSVNCTVRMGSPAQPLYRAELLYLPAAWIEANAQQIASEQATGTGENDYAFLRITGPTSPGGTLPSLYPNIALSAGAPGTGDTVLVAGYPAGFLDGLMIEKSLYPTSAFTPIGQLYTFSAGANVDVVSLGGTVVAQGGASGGAVVRANDGMLVALIATATAGTTTASRDLRAITISYINRSLAEQGKIGLAEFLSHDPAQQAADFTAGIFEQEKQKLVQALSSSR